MDALYLIWSAKHGMFWRPDRSGYTPKIEEAGRYGAEEAILLCAGSIYVPRGSKVCRTNSRPITIPDAARALRGQIYLDGFEGSKTEAQAKAGALS